MRTWGFLLLKGRINLLVASEVEGGPWSPYSFGAPELCTLKKTVVINQKKINRPLGTIPGGTRVFYVLLPTICRRLMNM